MRFKYDYIDFNELVPQNNIVLVNYNIEYNKKDLLKILNEIFIMEGIFLRENNSIKSLKIIKNIPQNNIYNKGNNILITFKNDKYSLFKIIECGIFLKFVKDFIDS